MSAYIGIMTGFLQSKYDVIDYNDLKRGIFALEDIDVIYLNWIEEKMDETDMNLLSRAKSLGINIVWVFHNRISHNSLDENKEIEKARYLANVSTNIILHSRTSINYLKELEPKTDERKTHYIPHLEFIGEYYSYGDIAKKYNISDDKLVFGLIGYIGRQKNIDKLIEAFKDINDDNCRLIVAGSSNDNEYVDGLRNMIKNDSRIILVEQYISSAQMKTFLANIDILVLPYNKRSCMNSGAMLMAFSYGKTVITTDIAMADDFDDGLIYKYHYNSEDDHSSKLQSAMEKAIASGKQKLEYQGRMLYNYVEANHSKDFVKNELYNLIENNERVIKEKSEGFRKTFELVNKIESNSYRANVALKLVYFNQNGESVSDFFNYNGFKTVAVYGYGQIGKYLVAELEKAGISVAYVIDRNATEFKGIQAYTLENDIPTVDVVIVTACGFNCIKDKLRQKGFKNIVSISDILELR
jgi:glycosyltransferase involved in cell wall biosynthesis